MNGTRPHPGSLRERMRLITTGVCVLAALLGGCGGGGDDPEASVTDPAQRCSSIGTQPLVANGTACVPSASTPVLLLLVVGAVLLRRLGKRRSDPGEAA